MKILGFNYTKINAECKETKKQPLGASTDIKFINIEKEESLNILKDNNIIKVNFSYIVSYQTQESKKDTAASIDIEGYILVAAEKEEVKEILSIWKKKELSVNLKLFLFNFILKKCTPKAVSLESELDLPYHIPIPKLTPVASANEIDEDSKDKKKR